MPTFNHYPIQQSIYQVLTADSTLMNLVTGVYDHAPQGTPFPYAVLGDDSGADWSLGPASSGIRHVLTLHVFSREGGRKQAAIIMERLHTLLHHGDIAVEGHQVMMTRFDSSAIRLEDDGFTYHGTMKFALWTRVNA